MLLWSSLSASAAPLLAEPVPGAALPNPLNWVSSTSAEIDQASSSDPEAAQYLDSTSPVVARLQLWSDELYDRLQTSRTVLHGTQITPSVPRPQLRVKIDAERNAFVRNALVCYKVPVRFPAQPAAAGAGVELYASLGAQDHLGLILRDHLACLDRTAEPVAAADVARFLTANHHVAHCQVSSEGEALVFGAGCVLPPNQAATASGIALNTSGIWITLTTGLLASMAGDTAALTALTHELGHYYRAHGALYQKTYPFFYSDEAANFQRETPLPDPALAPLGATLLRLPKARVQNIVGQHFSSWLFPYMAYTRSKLVAPACTAAASSCHAACAPWLALFSAPNPPAVFGAFPQAQLTGAALTAYWDYERLTQACLAAIAVSSDGPTGNGQAALADIKSVYWKGAWPQTGSVLDAAEAMSRQLFLEDQQNEMPLQEALDRQLGYYTTEQEADNIGLRWLALLGVDPHVAIDYWFDYAAKTSTKHLTSRYDFDYQTCRQLYDATPRWSAAGQPVRVPIGSFADIHHSACYRIYNIDQRLRYQPPPVTPALVPALDTHAIPWTDLR